MLIFKLVVELDTGGSMGQGILEVEADHISTAIQIAKVKGWVVVKQYETKTTTN